MKARDKFQEGTTWKLEDGMIVMVYKKHNKWSHAGAIVLRSPKGQEYPRIGNTLDRKGTALFNSLEEKKAEYLTNLVATLETV